MKYLSAYVCILEYLVDAGYFNTSIQINCANFGQQGNSGWKKSLVLVKGIPYLQK